MSNFWKGDPRQIYTRFSFTCPECGQHVKKSSPVVYFPQSKSAKCRKCGDFDLRQVDSDKWDEMVYQSWYPKQI